MAQRPDDVSLTYGISEVHGRQALVGPCLTRSCTGQREAWATGLDSAGRAVDMTSCWCCGRVEEESSTPQPEHPSLF
jgi:hypothetical protein